MGKGTSARGGAGVITCFCALALASAPVAAVDDFFAYLDPDTATVEPGSPVTVTFRAGEPAEHFNAYEITVLYDPGVLELVSVDEGSLMIAACPSSRFPSLVETDSYFTWGHALMCSAAVANGPGELCVVTFHGVAVGLSALDITTDPDSAFVDAGVCVNPLHPTWPRRVTLSGGAVVVGDPTGVEADAPAPAGSCHLRFAPNPARGPGTFRFSLPAASPYRLELFDARGRRVLRHEGRAGEGPQRLFWTGLGSGGEPLPGGVFFARLVADPPSAGLPTGPLTTKLVLVR
jgi:hypothetical protein